MIGDLVALLETTVLLLAVISRPVHEPTLTCADLRRRAADQ